MVMSLVSASWTSQVMSPVPGDVTEYQCDLRVSKMQKHSDDGGRVALTFSLCCLLGGFFSVVLGCASGVEVHW